MCSASPGHSGPASEARPGAAALRHWHFIVKLMVWGLWAEKAMGRTRTGAGLRMMFVFVKKDCCAGPGHGG
jgi:hypothetical protein